MTSSSKDHEHNYIPDPKRDSVISHFSFSSDYNEDHNFESFTEFFFLSWPNVPIGKAINATVYCSRNNPYPGWRVTMAKIPGLNDMFTIQMLHPDKTKEHNQCSITDFNIFNNITAILGVTADNPLGAINLRWTYNDKTLESAYEKIPWTMTNYEQVDMPNYKMTYYVSQTIRPFYPRYLRLV